MDDCIESQEVEQCTSDMTRCGEMYAQKGDEEFYVKACIPEDLCSTYCKDGYNEEGGFNCELYCCEGNFCNWALF